MNRKKIIGANTLLVLRCELGAAEFSGNRERIEPVKRKINDLLDSVKTGAVGWRFDTGNILITRAYSNDVAQPCNAVKVRVNGITIERFEIMRLLGNRPNKVKIEMIVDLMLLKYGFDIQDNAGIFA